MKNYLKKIPVSVLLMFVTAIGLLIFSAVGGARAVLTYYSDTYTATMDMYHIGVQLNEYKSAEDAASQADRNIVSYRNYIDNPSSETQSNWNVKTGEILTWVGKDDNEKFEVGKNIPEQLTVANTGSIDEYVRVICYRYWKNADGTKATDLDPELIVWEFNEDPDADGYQWVKGSETSDGKEREIYYLNKPLPVNSETSPFLIGVTIDDEVNNLVGKEEVITTGNVTVVKRDYEYEGKTFCIEVEVDAVQTHNGADAIKAAWGKSVTPAEDGSVSW